MLRREHNSKPITIREVYARDLLHEFFLIRRAIHEGYNFISMDTEFPGVIYSSKVDRRNLQPSELYEYLKANVNALKLIQLGLTLSDVHGNLPDFGTDESFIWQFNFRDFNIKRDLYNKESIILLEQQGIDFENNLRDGVDSFRFSEFMRWSGLFYNEAVTWITFHSAYDLAYLVKILTQNYLPETREEFLYELRRIFGWKIYDMKHMVQYCNGLYGGLERIAGLLNVSRAAGQAHQAGSDSLLTWHVFQKMVLAYFYNNDAIKHVGIIFGL